MNFPINTILYTKHWYSHRGDVDKMWMDLCHTINADGWTIYSKKEVSTWMQHRFDEFKKTVWSKNDRYCLSNFFMDMERHNDIWRINNDTDLSIEDKIIWTMCSYLSELTRDDIDEWVKPSPNVLPINLKGPWIESSFSGRNQTPMQWHGGEMMSDYIERVNKVFVNSKEQKISDYDSFEYVEGRIRGKDWKDVVVINGSDSLIDCFEMTFYGSEIKEYNTIFEDERNEGHLDLNIYDYCKFENDKQYTCRLKTESYIWDEDCIDYTYKIMSVKEYE